MNAPAPAATLPAGVEITAPITPDYAPILTPEALAFVAKLHRQFEGRRQELLARRRAAEGVRRRQAARLPPRDEVDPRVEVDDCRAAAGPARPPRRDHRPDRPQDGDQRAQLRRVDVHGGLRGRQLPDLGEHDRGPGQPARRGPPHDHASSRAGKQYKLNEKTAVLIPRPRGWHLDEKHVTIDGKPVSGGDLRLRAATSSTTRRSCSRAAPARTSTCPRWSRTSRRGSGTTSSRWRRSELGVPHGTIKATVLIETVRRRLRDGRDPVGAARALGRPQHRPLGLHLLLHQEVPLAPGFLPRRPRAGDDDRALHARLRAAAGEDLPPPQRARDGRHGGADPDQERPGRQRGRDGEGARRQAARGDRRLRRHLGRAPGPGADREGGVRQAHAAAEPVRQAAPRRERARRRTCSTSSPRRRSPRPGCATTSRSASSTSAPGSPATAACRCST